MTGFGKYIYYLTLLMSVLPVLTGCHVDLSSDTTKLNISPAETILVTGEPQEVKVLSLNNSLIDRNDQAQLFMDIARSRGKNAEWKKHTLLGMSLKTHWNEGDDLTEDGKPTAKMMIRSEPWTHIILQEHSSTPRLDYEKYKNSVTEWVDYIRKNCPNPNAVIILPMNWQYADDWLTGQLNNRILINNCTKLAKEMGVTVCPIASAYEIKYERSGAEALINEWFYPQGDEVHPSIRSSYLAALLEYAVIYDEDPREISYYPIEFEGSASMPLYEDEAQEIRDIASQTMKQYINTVNHVKGIIIYDLEINDETASAAQKQAANWNVTPSEGVETLGAGIFKFNREGIYFVNVKYGDAEAECEVRVFNSDAVIPND